MKKHRTLLFIPYFFVQFSWGIIQNLIGLSVFIFLLVRNPKMRPYRYGFSFVVPWKLSSYMGLGIFIFADRALKDRNDPILAHEFGHNIQSAILGPLFLPVIGIPSLIWAGLPFFRRYRRKNDINYYGFYTERWANAIGKKATGVTPPGFVTRRDF